MKATVYSCYMANISKEARLMQQDVVEKFLPKGWKFHQVLYSDSHGHAMQRCVDSNKNEISIFLDIDCIPLSKEAFRFLFDERWSCNTGSLIGCVQRANHIQNNKHLYVGPSCMAFMNQAYDEVGRPSFLETYRGDVGEELTYRWQEKGKQVTFLWPSDVQKPMWDLFDSTVQFGLGTKYENLFYHAFCARTFEGQNLFLNECNRVLGGEVLV